MEAWALGQYENLNLLVGMRKESSVADTVRSLDVTLSKEEMEFMEDAVRSIQVPVLDK